MVEAAGCCRVVLVDLRRSGEGYSCLRDAAQMSTCSKWMSIVQTGCDLIGALALQLSRTDWLDAQALMCRTHDSAEISLYLSYFIDLHVLGNQTH